MLIKNQYLDTLIKIAKTSLCVFKYLFDITIDLFQIGTLQHQGPDQSQKELHFVFWFLNIWLIDSV